MTKCSVGLVLPFTSRVSPFTMQISAYQDKVNNEVAIPVSDGTEHFIFLVCYKFMSIKKTNLISLKTDAWCYFSNRKRFK